MSLSIIPMPTADFQTNLATTKSNVTQFRKDVEIWECRGYCVNFAEVTVGGLLTHFEGGSVVLLIWGIVQMFSIFVTVDNRQMRKSAAKLEEFLEQTPDETSFNDQLDRIARIAASEDWKPSFCCYPRSFDTIRTSLDHLAGRDMYQYGTKLLDQDRIRNQIMRELREP